MRPSSFSLLAVILLIGCASPPPASTDCAAKYRPGTVEYATCYGNIDRQQSEMVDSMEDAETEDLGDPVGDGALVPPP